MSSEYGKDVNAYLAFGSHGVPVDKLINQARTQETEEENLYSRRKLHLAVWAADRYEIEIYWWEPFDEQFDYLIGHK
jgi:hypothetical protein